ncbi:MAG: hypothetical protein KDC24_13245, partial [Saprospiraceae bacterium]|nr:hypothetical protein [Saprospiraceae bacterium]
MKTIIEYSLLVVFGLFLSNSAISQGWERYLSTDFFTSAIENANGDISTLGGVKYDTVGSTTLFENILYRFNSNGDLLFSNSFLVHQNSQNIGVDLVEGQDGSMYFINQVGEVDPDSGQFINYFHELIKLDPFGQTVWVDTIWMGVPPEGNITTACQLIKNDSWGFFYIRSKSLSSQPDSGKILMNFQRLDWNGQSIGDDFELIISSQQVLPEIELTEGGFLINNYYQTLGKWKFELRKIDLLGNQIWYNNQIFDNESTRPTFDLNEDGEVFMIYRTQDINTNQRGIGVYKFSADGDLVDSTTFGFSNSILNDVEIKFQPVNSSFYYAYAQGNDCYFGRLNNNLSIDFQNQIGTEPNNLVVIADKITALSSGGNLVNGIYLSLDNGKMQGYVSCFDQLGRTRINSIDGSISFNPDSCSYASSNIFFPNQIVNFEKNGTRSYGTTDSTGWYYQNVELGDYKVFPNPPNATWGLCQDTLVSNQVQPLGTDTLHFLLQPEVECPSMEVTISTPFLRRCFDNTLYVNYCNEGTIPAQDAFVEITIDPRLEVTGSEIPWSGVNGNVYTFDLGDVGLFECGDFKIYTHLPCDSVELGQTLCLEAHIYPDSICTPPDSLWNGSDLRVSGYCDGDSVRFIIKNEGAALPTQQDFIIIEDDMVMRFGNTTPLGAEETYEVSVPAEGSTYRLQMEQVPGHPWSRRPGITIENCGENAIGGTNTGYVTMYEPDDAADFLDVECVEVRGSYDPNDKEAFPKGVCASHFIDNDTEIEYKIRFQNVGNDTAFKVVIKDTLSQYL